VWFYTDTHGQIRAVAKGIKRPTSKLAGATIPLTLNHLELQQGKDLHTLRVYDRLASFHHLHQDIERLAVGTTLTDVLHHLGQENDEDSAAIYSLLKWALEGLDNKNEPWVATSISFHLQLLNIAGFLPHFKSCVTCDEMLALDDHEYFPFSMGLGGFLCFGCRYQAQGASLVNMSTRTIQLFLDPHNQTLSSQTVKAHRFLAFYWGQRLERNLKSFDFLYQLLEDQPQRVVPIP